MSFNKPFRAVPIKRGPRYRKQHRREKTNTIVKYLGGAALAGAALGTGSIAASEGGIASLTDRLRPLAVSLGFARARTPQEGDHWAGCNEARSAGTAPIYAGEPGYREALDGDFDGIACEPYPGV